MTPEQRRLPIAVETTLGSDYQESYRRLQAFAARDPRTFQTLISFSNAVSNLGTDFVRIIMSQGRVYYAPATADHLIFVEIENEGIISADYRSDTVHLGKFDGPGKLGLQHSYPGFSLILPVGQELTHCTDPSKLVGVEVRPSPETKDRFIQFMEADTITNISDNELVEEGLAQKYCPVTSPTDAATIQSYARLLREFVTDLMPLLPPPVTVPEVFDF